MSLDILSDFDTGWLAGMLDGEGYVTITRDPDGDTAPLVSIASTTKEAIDSIAQMTGIGCVHADLKPVAANRKIVYRWRVRKTYDVIVLLLRLIPHLRIKKAQAVIAVEYCMVKLKGAKRGTLETKCIPYYEKMKTLNKRGS